MKQATHDAVVTLLRNDPTVDNRMIDPAMDVLKGKTAMGLLTKEVDRVISRRQAAEILGCSLRTIDELGRRKKIRRRPLLGTKRCGGYSLHSIRQFQMGKDAK